MAKRLSISHRKASRNKARAYAEAVKSGKFPAKHKVAVERSTRAKKKKAYRMA